jgi:hypothetical protein
MNALGYDAMTVGNHEFDRGSAVLASFIAQARFPVISANIDATADAALDGDVRPFDVFLFDGGRRFGLLRKLRRPRQQARFDDVCAFRRRDVERQE